ncbi:hypothetical protein D9757_004896 [Collybiopsis confluens]|uniref:Uncharacterized protein n=1 Tax=Collybiopsis confluens TaxID=2823264 RepID=A0A8H5MCL5_9AGAR|nr:hypothetical protein D9757_004896 [Collybiopsis confluens]
MDPASIRSLLRCPICNNFLSNPSTLHCGHSICSTHDFCSLHSPPVPSGGKVDISLQKIIHLVDRDLAARPAHNDSGDTQDGDDNDAVEIPMKRSRSVFARGDDEEEDDLLAHLRSESARQRILHHNESEPPIQRPLESFEKELVTELNCEICFSLMYEPVTTPCQHTFCSRCLHRSLDHSSVCPLCRQGLPDFAYFVKHPQNHTMLKIILHACPSAYKERETILQVEEHNARVNTPIFVCQLSFPGMPTLLHFFEPKYRLMLRRCLAASDHPSFGMIMSSSASSSSASSSHLNAGDQIEYGTMLEIRSVQMLPDGRSMVETWGAWRFRILERGLLDGYVVGRIERIDDIPDEDDDEESEDAVSEVSSATPSTMGQLGSRPISTASSSSSSSSSGIESPARSFSEASPSSSSLPFSEPEPSRHLPLSTRQLIEHCNYFLSQLHTSTTPWVVQRLSYTHGPAPPSDPLDPTFDASTFSFYVGMVLPIDDWEKAKLLPVRSVRMRLKMTATKLVV